MARRSRDANGADHKFPIRVKVRIPPTGLGTMLVEMDVWLRANLGVDCYGYGPATAAGMNATAYHFMSIDDAQTFLKAFPKLELAAGFVPPPSLTDGSYR
ncbi:hypothetical protein SAMN05444339_102100 [Loktanella atrilutea]|uniref:Uncharacterized protein n=1 Tax=Loktanella atrilutea TaxID=366533 RepID=A0A1M4WFY5_LOKAT|nr:hypothetical protein [Loktanella atrilutea]SHE80095.1 hypothetical protein SAMN05444339_102100 [Loktanella atrilutea]